MVASAAASGAGTSEGCEAEISAIARTRKRAGFSDNLPIPAGMERKPACNRRLASRSASRETFETIIARSRSAKPSAANCGLAANTAPSPSKTARCVSSPSRPSIMLSRPADCVSVDKTIARAPSGKRVAEALTCMIALDMPDERRSAMVLRCAPRIKSLQLAAGNCAKIRIFANQIKRGFKSGKSRTGGIGKQDCFQIVGQHQHSAPAHEMIANPVEHGNIDERIGCACHCTVLLPCLTLF